MRAAVVILLVNAGVYLTTCSEPPTALEMVRQSGKLRVVTRNSPTTYYLGPHGPLGPEYEFARRFADHLGVELEIFSAGDLQAVLPALLGHEADIAAAGLTITDERSDRVRFATPYQRVSQQLIYRIGTRRPRSVEDVVGTRLEIIAGSSHAPTLRRLKREHPDLAWTEVPATHSDDLMYRVAEKEIDFTIADSAEVDISRRYHPELRVAFEVGSGDELAWAFRRLDDTTLYDEAQAFFAELAAQGETERILERYYGYTGDFDYVGTRRFLRHIETRLPRYLDLFQEAAARHGLDWHLLAAQGYQESHWNPRAVSPTGVRGIMMLTQAAAADLGIDNRIDPRQSIRGGARYLLRMKRRIPERIPEPDRTWMALAAYNVGFWHLEDARIITQLRGGDPDRWTDVRENLPLLAQSKWYRRVKRGYARGWEPVTYVDNIRSYLDLLQWHFSDRNPDVRMAADDEPAADTQAEAAAAGGG